MCSLFGLIDYGNYFTAKQKEKIIRILSIECEVRGTDATGVAYVENEEVKVYKQPLPAHKIKMKFKSNHKIIMGHTRMTTKGDERFKEVLINSPKQIQRKIFLFQESKNAGLVGA